MDEDKNPKVFLIKADVIFRNHDEDAPKGTESEEHKFTVLAMNFIEAETEAQVYLSKFVIGEIISMELLGKPVNMNK